MYINGFCDSIMRLFKNKSNFSTTKVSMTHKELIIILFIK